MKSDPTKSGDEELLRRMGAGDEDAFLVLYRRRQGEIYRFAFHMSGSRTVAEEVTQEVFLTLIGGNAKYDRNRGTVAAFLLGVARNHVLRCLERNRPYVALEESDVSGDRLVSGGNPLGELTRSETIESVRRAVLALPAAYREAVVLCDLEEMNYAEAAAVLGCPVGTVRSRLHRARVLLGERLREEGRTRETGCAV